MAYYLEIRFAGEGQKWQRNPSPFASANEAHRAGVEFVNMHQPDPKMQAEVYRLTPTGYKSLFPCPDDLAEYESPLAFVLAWLDYVADSEGWTGQMALF